ncbi:MAG: phosphoribosylanthranilate isomerase [Clostridiales bacterium]|nr:phosphoribosylanthranilate isomerase [Clostridiales bacterium]MCF8023433.1 phosphoribosylanthranilate isomerase [Clostridiales bacterium]
MFFNNNTKVNVKICGIKDSNTAQVAVESGADALGFIFAPESKRCIKPETAREIIDHLSPRVNPVGVFTNTPLEEIEEIAYFCNLQIIQLHGYTGQEKIKLDLPLIRAVRVKNKPGEKEINTLKADAVLLDTYHPHLAGGTGKTFNWDYTREINIKSPLILAGGLTPGNVATAIKKTRPCAVDVSTGVETEGKKDTYKIKEFINKAKGGSL